MSLENWVTKYINVETGEVQEQAQSQSGGIKPQHLIIEDASSISARVLVPQLGSDKVNLAKGKVDVRRFSNIDKLDVVWQSWFRLIPKQYGGGFAYAYCEEWLNLCYSVGGENKKLVVKMQEAMSGKNTQKDEPKSKGILERIGLRKGDRE